MWTFLVLPCLQVAVLDECGVFSLTVRRKRCTISCRFPFLSKRQETYSSVKGFFRALYEHLYSNGLSIVRQGKAVARGEAGAAWAAPLFQLFFFFFFFCRFSQAKKKDIMIHSRSSVFLWVRGLWLPLSFFVDRRWRGRDRQDPHRN